jgi:hypothetical protein
VGFKAVCIDGAFLARAKVQIFIALSDACNIELPAHGCIFFLEVFDLTFNYMLRESLQRWWGVCLDLERNFLDL